LKTSKSPGADNLSPRLVKDIASVILEPLLYIYNLSLASGVVPAEMKLAKVIPVLKKGDPQLPGNYRPISLLSIFDKLLEKIMYSRLFNFLSVNKVLYDYQFGFRKNYSTGLALLEVTDSIYQSLDKGDFCCGVYLDLQKAFDTVNHDILLKKLYNYGIRGIVYQWFKSYLTNRRQFTCIDDTISDNLCVTCGVPQGSVLGPLLFLLYVNDIGRAVPQGNVKLFADDTNLFIFGNSCAAINAKANLCVHELNQWFIANKLSLNLIKTCCMNFSTKPLGSFLLHCGSNVINEVDSCKYLGLVIDNELKWTSHIDTVYRDLVKYSSIFYKVREKLPSWMLKHIYFTFVHSRILYGIEVYANTCGSYLDKLIKLNNKLLRILQNKTLSTPVFELYLEYNTLPIPQLHIQQLLLFVHKFVHHPDTLPAVFVKNNYFIPNSQVHNYSTRDNKNLHLLNFSTNIGSRNTKFKAARLWNELPQFLKDSSSIQSFKNN
jgi:hypothetical protein